ncbi:MAG: hypothetical protein L0207_04990 [Chlamydiae bacterium]|nr:hypothetical protein [Chlamydiota bacterium]
MTTFNTIIEEQKFFQEIANVFAKYDFQQNMIAINEDGSLKVVEKANKIYEQFLEKKGKLLVALRIEKFIALSNEMQNSFNMRFYSIFYYNIRKLILDWDPNFQDIDMLDDTKATIFLLTRPHIVSLLHTAAFLAAKLMIKPDQVVHQ